MMHDLDKAGYDHYLSLKSLNHLYSRNQEYAMKKSFDWLVSYIENI